MFKYTKALLCYVLITFILIGFVFLGLTYKTEYVPTFCFSVDNKLIKTTAYKNSESNYTLFLPSHVKLSEIKLILPQGHDISIGETKMHNNMTCAEFDLDVKYSLLIDGTKAYISFLQSKNIPSLYINTGTGSMERIHQNKDYRESAEILLISNDGKTEHCDKRSTIKGRGNATWKYEKKPYILTLSEEASLLGMGKSSKWILLANALDYSGLRNKLAMDMARKIGFGWSPDCKFVDVYLNGDYNGLYLLSEKIQVGPEQLDLDLNNGDFLCTVDFENRWDSMSSPFHTDSGRAVEICDSETLSEDAKSQIHNKVNEMEKIIFSSNTLTDFESFDLDSWVCRYLMDEIFCNLDSDVTSSYFYCKDNILFAGPIWDYDMTLGTTFAISNPEALYAKLKIKYSGNITTYYNALYNNSSFYNRMKEIYSTRFLPLLNEYNSYYIDELSFNVKDAVYMNNIRWKDLFEHIFQLNVIIPPSEDNSPKTYLSKRTDFLNRICVNNEEFISVQFNADSWSEWKVFSVKKGETLENETMMEGVSWIIKDTAEQFDITKPVQEDLIIEANPTPTNSSLPHTSFSFTKKELLTIFCLLLVSVTFLALAIIEIYKIRQKGRTYER